MRDPALESQIIETEELQTRWKQFSDFVEMGMSGKPVKPEAEMKFMELKSRIIMLHDGFMEGLEHSKKTGMNMVSILNDCITLSRLAESSDADKQKFKYDWNECYILLTEQITGLHDIRTQLESISEKAVRARQRSEMMRANVHNFFTGPAFKIIIGLVIAIAVFYIVPAFVWPYSNFGKIKATKGAYLAVVNNFYRPFLSGDFPFTDLDDVPLNKKVDEEFSVSTPRADDFYHGPMNDFIGSTGRVQEVINAVQTGKAGGNSVRAENISKGRMQGSFLLVVFKDVQTAEDFAKLLNTIVQTLPAREQSKTYENFTMIRFANFISFGISKDTIRRSYAIDKYCRGNEDLPDLLD